jgi:hypothetical protein
MTNEEIEETILRGCGKKADSFYKNKCGDKPKFNINRKFPKVLCTKCRAKYQQHKESYSKAIEDVEKIIDNFHGEEYTDFEIWEDIKIGLKSKLKKLRK